MPCKDKIWTTAEGVDVILHDMTDRHLSNAINMCQEIIDLGDSTGNYDDELDDLLVERERRDQKTGLGRFIK